MAKKEGGNDLQALNDALFEQLERLRKAEGDQVDGEIKRAKAVNSIATSIVNADKLALETVRLKLDYSGPDRAVRAPKQIGG